MPTKEIGVVTNEHFIATTGFVLGVIMEEGKIQIPSGEVIVNSSIKPAAEEFIRMRQRITNLEMQLSLLKEILIKQGVRVITSDQARQLGIDV